MIIKEINASETWQIRHSVMWPDQPLEFVKLEEDESGLHYGAFVNDSLVSIVSCFIQDDEMQFRKLATVENYQDQGIASKLLVYVFEEAREKNVKRIWCNARVAKKKFYEKFGMEDLKKTFIKEGQEFTIMEVLL